VAIPFPSLAFFEALRKRTTEDAVRFEKLGYCDTSFGVKTDQGLYAVRFEVYECIGVEQRSDAKGLDFVLIAPTAIWKRMLRSIQAHGGADAEHTLNTLSHIGDLIQVEYEDAEGHDKFYRFMATIQEFFDQAHHLDLDLRD
jgi:hypothetical protein